MTSFTGRRREMRRESLPCGDLSMDHEAEARRRPSFLKMVSLGKLKRESMSDRGSFETEEEEEEEEPVVKPREPLSGKIRSLDTSEIVKNGCDVGSLLARPILQLPNTLFTRSARCFVTPHHLGSHTCMTYDC